MPHPSHPIVLALAGARRYPNSRPLCSNIAILSDRIATNFKAEPQATLPKKRRKTDAVTSDEICSLRPASTCLPVDVLVSIIHQSDWETLAAWRATSRAFFTVVASLLRRRYDAHIAPFVSDIPLFNDMLRRHAAIISGSIALHFFLPDASWNAHTLDIYVPVEKYSDFILCVTDPAGLNWKPRPPRTPEGDAAAHSVSTTVADEVESDHDEEDEADRQLLARHDRTTPSIVCGSGSGRLRSFQTPNNRRVHIICSLSNNPITPLRFFFSSLLMNFLTPDACVCGFPSASLDRLGVLKGNRLSYCEQADFKKYRRRGFRFDTDPLRQALDMWDFIFFGERDVLAFDFCFNTSDARHPLPIKPTPRGWVPDPDWLADQPQAATGSSADSANHHVDDQQSQDPVPVNSSRPRFSLAPSVACTPYTVT